ncbi:44493_t:CDS:1, partial [Gigaspora margarita]
DNIRDQFKLPGFPVENNSDESYYPSSDDLDDDTFISLATIISVGTGGESNMTMIGLQGTAL